MNPYSNLDTKAFWKKAVAEKSMFDLSDLWAPKFKVEATQRVSTYGSCFAQHFGRALKKNGLNWFIAEQPPLKLSEANQTKFNYGIFSSRTGNIYTTSLLLQWVKWALNIEKPSDEVWEKNGRFFDPFRPRVEPNGFESTEELFASRAQTIRSFEESFRRASLFVFTLGLTESWFNNSNDTEYPMCPGTIAGEFDETIHKFKNQSFSEIKEALVEAIRLMRTVNPNLKFLLTVSPVPLTATKSNMHVMVATMHSKSILRAVAGEVADSEVTIDYFPSYEIINSPVTKGAFFEPNQRNVNPYGVNFVMKQFFDCQEATYGKLIVNEYKAQNKAVTSRYDEICEEELLEAFGK